MCFVMAATVRPFCNDAHGLVAACAAAAVLYLGSDHNHGSPAQQVHRRFAVGGTSANDHAV